MTRAAGEAFADLRPGQRTLLYSRSSFIGSHRYGGIWLGDNNSSWAQLLANIQMMPSVQMCGFLYSGADSAASPAIPRRILPCAGLSSVCSPR